MSLHFEYCECGCHGSESEIIGRTSFWLFDTLKGTVYLHRGHGSCAELIKKCTSYEEAIKIATDEARILLDDEQKKLDNIRKQINEKPAKELSFRSELLAQFPGKENVYIRELIRKCCSSRKIRLLSKSVAFSEIGRAKLEIVAEAFDRPVK